MVNIRSVHQKGALSPVWDFQMRFPVMNLYVQTTLSHDPFGLKPISSQFQTWDGRSWIYLRSLGAVFESRFIVGCWIEILGVIGNDGDVWFEFRLVKIFIISYVASSFSCSLISPYIRAILWNTSHSSLGSLCPVMLLLMLDTFTDSFLIFFLCLSWPSSILITEQVYLDDSLGVKYLVDFRVLTAFMKNFSSDPNVLTSISNPWSTYISADATTNASLSELR